jgi:hypothetical protein
MKRSGNIQLVLTIFSVLFLFGPLLLPAGQSGASDQVVVKKSPHRVPTVTEKAKIDGILNEELWKQALVLGLDYEVEPGENITPAVKTEVLLVSSAAHLYVAFRASDPQPKKIRARFTDRDNISNDDHVGIILDTFNDSRRSYGFYSNPYGIQADQILNSGGVETGHWDAIWDSAGRMNKGGYIVEMAIPFSTLRFQRVKGDQVWRVDAVRSYPRNLSHLIGLFPRDRSDNCYMCQADRLIGFSGVRPGKNIELDPTLSGVLTQERENFPEGKFATSSDKIDPGLTVRWSFTPNLTLNAAINPDFSHVEADAAQLDINTPFALFYPEKRPFFLEGASIFLTPFWAIYTRTVGDPDWGIKLTGKEGKHVIGFFTARDATTNLLFPSSQFTDSTLLDIPNISSALRYYYDIGKSSLLGAVVTNREGDDYFNRMAGIDGDLKFTKRDRVVFQFLGSQSRYPDQVVTDFNQPEGKLKGSALGLVYIHSTQHVTLSMTYESVTPNFRGDVGFFEQTDYRYIDISGGYKWRHNPGHWYTLLGIGAGYSHDEDHNGGLLQKGFYGWLNFNGPLQSSVYLNVNMGKRAFMGVEFDNNNLGFNAGMRPSGDFYLGLNGAFGDEVDYANIQAANQILLNPVIQYNIGRHLYVGFDHVFQKLDVEAGRLYTANLSNIRLVYQINRRAFLRAILQYAHFKYNPGAFNFPIDPLFTSLFSQVLFSYKINPRTVLFLGYSDDYYGATAYPLKQSNRTLFLKIGYALVL